MSSCLLIKKNTSTKFDELFSRLAMAGTANSAEDKPKSTSNNELIDWRVQKALQVLSILGAERSV